MKKIVALILAVALMLGAMPFAFAAESNHDCGTNAIDPSTCNHSWVYFINSDGTTTIRCINGCNTKFTV